MSNQYILYTLSVLVYVFASSDDVDISNKYQI